MTADVSVLNLSSFLLFSFIYSFTSLFFFALFLVRFRETATTTMRALGPG